MVDLTKIAGKAKILEIITAVVFISIGIIFRILPHAPNFTPIAAMALFGAVYLPKKLAVILPIAAMAISDALIGFYNIKIMAAVYGSFIVCSIIGFQIRKNKKWRAVLGGSLLSSAIFFLLTNFAVFAFTPWYDKTFSGLVQCYFMALPFLKNTLLGDLFYGAIFFGTYELAKILITKKFATEASYHQIKL